MKEITIKDYRDFCSAQYDCDQCPLCGDDVTGIYEHCLGYITEHPEKTDDIIRDWQAAEEKRKIEKRQPVCVIYDKYFTDTIYGVASSYETAVKMLSELANKALKDILAVDPEDSGINWDKMNEQQKAEFFEKQVKSSFSIKETKLDCYIYDEEVHAI